jgi:ABC-type multidrug transport system fused ATPase/permease subunit
LLAVLFVCGVMGYTRLYQGVAMTELLPLLAVYLAALMQLMPAVAELGTNWVSMQALRPRLLAAREILEGDDLCEDFSGEEVLFEEEISLEGVGFDYGDGAVLEEMELVIRRGENVAVVGESGAGKSTLIDLLLRLQEPVTGVIRVDGVDYREIGLACWRSQLAMVSQDPVLFHDTVAANILMGNPEAGMEEVRTMARAAQADGFIGEMPEGYETMVGERGVSLSGGQRQRLAIARALIRRPRLLILDEATSALDSVTMREMERSIHGLLPETACVFVTHRLWSARLADRIYVLDEGRLAGVGSHEELLAGCAVYQRLWAAHEHGEEVVSRG